jgi:hypothetical protein
LYNSCVLVVAVTAAAAAIFHTRISDDLLLPAKGVIHRLHTDMNVHAHVQNNLNFRCPKLKTVSLICVQTFIVENKFHYGIAYWNRNNKFRNFQ